MRAKNTDALANRIAAHEWMQLIGDDAKYLRKVRILVWTMHGTVLLLDHLLISVASDSSGKAPLVVVSPDSRASVAAHSFRAMRARHLQTIIQDYLVETNDMGKVWHAMTERAMYPFSGNIENFDFDISEQGIADIAAKYPLIKRPKASAKKSTSSFAYPGSFSKRNASPATEVPGYDSDCIEIEAPNKNVRSAIKQAEVSKALPNGKISSWGGQDKDLEIMEVYSSSKNPPAARKKAQKAIPTTKATKESSISTRKIAQATKAIPALRGEDSKNIVVGEPAQSTKAAKAGAAEMVYGAASLTTATHEVEVEVDINPKPVTRSSTRKRQPRKL